MSKALENTFGALALALSDDIDAVLGAKGLLSSEFEAIGHIGHAPGMTIADLANAIALSHAATVRLVARLELKKLIVRRKSPTDGRSVILKLSAKGIRLHDDLLSRRQERLQSAIGFLSAKDQRLLAKLSNRILRKMLRDEQHAFRVCRLCAQPICDDCPVEAEMIEREERQLSVSGGA